MTVCQLIALLKEFEKKTPDAIIKTEGCQMCVHNITGAEYYKNDVWLKIEDLS